MMLEGEISPQSCLLFHCGPRESLFPFFFCENPDEREGATPVPEGNHDESYTD